MTSDNIIQFPKKSNRKNEPAPERKEPNPFVELDMTDLILSQLNYNGISIEKVSKNQLRDIAFIIEATRSLVFRYEGKSHLFHKIIDSIFEENEEGLYLKPHANT